MGYAVRVEGGFRASHAVRLPGGAMEEVHWHDWGVWVTVARDAGGLDELAFVVDFHDVERELKRIAGPWEGGCLNDLLQGVNPTAEVVAGTVAGGVKVTGARVVRVEVREAPGCVAIWAAEDRWAGG